MASSNYDKIFLQDDFRSFLDYIEIMEEFLASDRHKREETLQEMSSNGLFIITDKYNDPEYLGNFDGFFRNSVFVSLYSILESRLISESRSRKNDKIQLGFDDIRAQDVMERVKKYFTKVLQTTFPNNTHEWASIQEYRLLRNCIVHAQSNVSKMKDTKEQEKLRNFINQEPDLTLFGDTVYLGEGFCEKACKIIETFLIMLLYSDEAE